MSRLVGQAKKGQGKVCCQPRQKKDTRKKSFTTCVSPAAPHAVEGGHFPSTYLLLTGAPSSKIATEFPPLWFTSRNSRPLPHHLRILSLPLCDSSNRQLLPFPTLAQFLLPSIFRRACSLLWSFRSDLCGANRLSRY